MEDMCLTVSQVVERTKIGRNAVYAAIASGSLRAIAVGAPDSRKRRLIIPVAAVQEWLDRLSEKTLVG